MDSESAEVPGKQPPEQLEELLAECIQHVESGQPEQVERLLREHPSHAERVQRMIDSLVGMGIVDDSELASGEPDVPVHIGRYRVRKEIARGGQGIVYLAEDTALPRDVAIKVLRGHDSADLVARFWREAAVASKLRHPSICTVYEAGTDRGTPFIAMEYLPGETLAERIEASRLKDANQLRLQDELTAEESDSTSTGPRRRHPLHRVLELVETAARALHSAHEVGVVHRDVKPSNMILSPRGVVLTDFGLARDEESQQPTLTRSGDLFGTPEYMSPEQISRQGAALDRRTDVWSLGVTLFECVTLTRPFASPTRAGLYREILDRDAPDPRSINPGVPRDLAVVVERALEKERDRRYRTAAEFAEELRRVREFEPILARPASAGLKLRRWAQRNTGVAASLGGVFLVLVAGLIVSAVLLASREAALGRYEQMSDAGLVRRLIQREQELWPRRAVMVSRMEAWLAEARAMLERMPMHRRALEEIRGHASVWSSAARVADARRRRDEYPEFHARLANLRTDWSRLAESDARSAIAAEIAELELDPRNTRRFTFEFESGHENAWRHSVLVELLDMEPILRARVDEVSERVEFARAIRRRTVEDASAAWSVCARDVAESEIYGGLKIDPQVGLIPLGRDAASGLWEFWHVGTGPRPRWNGEVTHGSVAPNDDSGVVLVLLPGGAMRMGAQSTDPSAVGYDEFADERETVVQRRVEPFFVGKYEMTQAQWMSITGHNPSYHVAGGTPPGQIRPTTLRNPVEHVDWVECREVLARVELVLPSEAQWEFGARGGSDSRWWTGDEVESLQDAANVADATAARITAWDCADAIEDGFVAHSPVGSFRANAFGLHDVVGNVWEWCDDVWAPYRSDGAATGNEVAADDPSWGPTGAGFVLRVQRGGAFDLHPMLGRVARRWGSPRFTTAHDAGVRAARPLQP